MIKLSTLQNKRMNSINQIALAALFSRKDYVNELISIKPRIDVMTEMEYYLKNKHELIKLLSYSILNTK